MKKEIENLVKLGISETEALTIVKNIAMYAFEEGCFNMDFDDNYGLVRDMSFDDWFKVELSR